MFGSLQQLPLPFFKAGPGPTAYHTGRETVAEHVAELFSEIPDLVSGLPEGEMRHDQKIGLLFAQREYHNAISQRIFRPLAELQPRPYRNAIGPSSRGLFDHAIYERRACGCQKSIVVAELRVRRATHWVT
jgi:hypothetical protein